jgi:hypothetical protein
MLEKRDKKEMVVQSVENYTENILKWSRLLCSQKQSNSELRLRLTHK